MPYSFQKVSSAKGFYFSPGKQVLSEKKNHRMCTELCCVASFSDKQVLTFYYKSTKITIPPLFSRRELFDKHGQAWHLSTSSGTRQRRRNGNN